MLRQVTQTRLYGKPLVKPAQVETELERIRSAAAAQDAAREEEATGTASARARATLSNLVVLNASTSGERVDQAIDSLIDELCVSYPSRFFIIDANLQQDSVPTGIATAVSSRCFLTDSGAHVCSEEVYVSVEEKAVPLLKNLLISLFAPDVDAVLLVVGDVINPETQQSLGMLLNALEPMSDRIVYDSGSFVRYAQSLQLLLAPETKPSSEGERNPEDFTKLSDINWKRTRRWRALISEGFDAERLAETSVQISKVIFYCQTPKEEITLGNIPGDALLVAGWICSSLEHLGIKKVSAGVFETPGKMPLRIEFVSEGSAAAVDSHEGKLKSVEVIAETGESQARLRIERRFDRKNAEISLHFQQHEASPSDISARNAPFVSASAGDLVLSHIVSRRDDMHYFRALELSLAMSAVALG